MKLEFNQQAADAFNRTALDLVREFAAVVWSTAAKPSFEPEIEAKTLTEQEIVGPIIFSNTDGRGNTVAKYVSCQGKNVGLIGEGYKKYAHLCESIQRTATFRDTISMGLVSVIVFDWLRKQYSGETVGALTDYLISSCASRIGEYEIWLPIARLVVESDLPIGKIVIRNITRVQIDRWQTAELARSKGLETRVNEFIESQRKRYQGYAAATMKVTAEPEKAGELAVEEAERAIAVLRFFSPATLDPDQTCYWHLLGKEHVESITTLTYANEPIPGFSQASTGYPAKTLVLNDGVMAKMKEAGLDRLSRLLTLTSTTDFQRQLLDSLLLYSRVSVVKEASDKLVFLLASLEGILLKDKSEVVMQNLAERMAFLIETRLEARKQVIKNVKAIYESRSDFIHHAQTVADKQALAEFMGNAWRVFRQAIAKYEEFQTRTDFVRAIDDLKLSGSGTI